MESTTADWLSADKGLPTADESYSSILDAAPTSDDGAAVHSQKRKVAPAPIRTIEKSSIAKETASIHPAAEHIGELGESQGVDDGLETSGQAAIDEVADECWLSGNDFVCGSQV